MTNEQIVSKELKKLGYNPSEELHVFDTYAGWKARGRQVKRGEKAKFQTKIFKPCRPKKDKDGEIVSGMTFIMVPAAYFRIEQTQA